MNVSFVTFDNISYHLWIVEPPYMMLHDKDVTA